MSLVLAGSYVFLACSSALQDLLNQQFSIKLNHFIERPVVVEGNGDNFELVWSDVFDYEGLPDPTYWDYEEGFVRNKESQYYTRARLENARVLNGHLIIECRKENFTTANQTQVEYTSASLIAKENILYGRIEVKAKIPQGRGVWPAIWTLGANKKQTGVGWPRCGEIDIMEYVGKFPDRIHGNIHYFFDGRHQSNHGSLETERPFDDFHVYAIEWTPNKIDFYFDKQQYHSVDICAAVHELSDNPFHRPHQLKLNFALGGSWGGPIDDSILPQHFMIEYVRVYRFKEGSMSAHGGLLFHA